MSVMPRTHAGSKSKPGYSRGFMRRLLLPSLAACSLVSLFSLPKVAAQVKANAAATGFAPPGSVPVIGTPVAPSNGGSPLPAGLRVTTERFNNFRNGVNNQETILTPANVVLPQPVKNPLSFGKLFSRTVDGLIYGQPLYVQNLPVSNSIGQVTTHNVVFVATNNNSVYAFDADTNVDMNTVKNSGPLWHANFNVPGANVGPTNGNDVTTVFGLPQFDIQPLIGIVGTPVIDETTGTLYVVARTTEGNNFAHRLHALDIRTGQERINSPALVGQYQDANGNILPISVPGTGDDSDGNGNVTFDLLNQNQRPALTLVNGTVYITYGSFDNSPPYHGWVFGYNTANIQAKPTAFCTTPNNVADQGFFPQPTEGGIEMSGVGPASDGSSLYFTTGLGALGPVATREYVQSILRLPLSLTDDPTDLNFGVFRPSDYVDLSTAQLDLTTGGIALANGAIPGHPNVLITAGQEGKIYLLDRLPVSGSTQPGLSLISTLPNNIDQNPPLLGANYGAPTIFTDNSNPTNPVMRVFFHASGDAVRSFNVTNTFPFLQLYAIGTAAGNSANRPLNFGFPGAQTVISASNGANGILWEVESAPVPNISGGGQTTQDTYAVLHAYDTATLTELFNSNMKGGGINSIGNYMKFTQPLVVNGKVYVASAAPLPAGVGGVPQGQLTVFGLTATQPGTTGQGTHYQLSGPVGWSGVGIGVVEANRAYQYSLTAVGPNNQAQAITATLTLSLTDGLGRQTSLGSVSFANQSYITFTKTINIPGFYTIVARDSNGNSSQANSEIFADQTTITGFDRFNLRMPTTVRNGQLTNVTVTPVDFRGFPTTFPGNFIAIYDTIPNGTQDLVFGPANFAYEFQYGIGPSIQAGASIGITDNGGIGASYPNINGTGTYPCIFNGVGQHVVIILDDFFGQMTTGVINVVP